MADSLGQILKSTRERKRISLSYAAAQTRVKLQYLEMMERDDFSRMPAPAYAKGFIKMYAEFLGLDPHPLVQDYVKSHVGKKPTRLHEMSLKPPPPAPAPPPAPEQEAEPEPVPSPRAETEVPAPAAPVKPRRSALKRPDLAFLKNALAGLPWRQIVLVFSVVLVLVLLVNALARCARRLEDASGRPRSMEFKRGIPATLEEPPEPYLPMPAEPAESKR